MNILNFVREQIVRHNMLRAGDKVLAACSGGCDSMTLVHILYLLQDEIKIHLAVANVNHMLRPEAADESLLVEKFCEVLKIPCYHQDIDVLSFKKESGLSLQEAARQKRYEYLHETAKKLGGIKIATGHHLDDQAETVLIHLLRGSGSVGIGGIKQYGDIIRPLLLVRRSQIENYCAENIIPYCQDMSNFKKNYLRNRIRLDLIPLLEREYNNKIKERLARTAEIALAESDFIKISARGYAEKIIRSKDQTWHLDIEQFKNLHLALQRELMRQIIEKILGSLTGISFTHVESLIKLASGGRVGAVLALPSSLAVRKTYDSLIFSKKADASAETDIAAGEISPVPLYYGVTPIPELGMEITLKLHKSYPSDTLPNKAGFYTAVFDCDQLEPPFLLRTRRKGDRFAPKGMSGSKKLKDFFIDKKVPREERDFIPLILDKKGIIWVAGYRQAERGQVTLKTAKFLQFIVTKGAGV